ncbi:MAG: Gfo/Idh/MocA family oxidoreductase [Limnochordia bacterium]|jgi:predicted dehydrogenase|nr:Gfo/Idh/MocA family oxidoreductase [Limnochordia bacterium]
MSQFRVLVVGCGNMSQKWIEYALSRQDCEIVGLVDLRLENARRTRSRHNLDCQVHSSLDSAIAETSPNLVFDVTVPESHRDVVITALRSGCNVFGEKPMATNMEQAREMLATSKQTGKTYAVMQNRRYLKNIRAFRNIVDSDIIGHPSFLTADFFLAPHFGGFRESMDSPLMLDMAIHTFDQARFVIGSDPISVYCHEFNPHGSWYKGDAAAVCTFEFDNGVVFSYRGCWCAQGYPTSWESSWRLVGSRGTAIWDGESLPTAEVVIPTDKKQFLMNYEQVEVPATWEGSEGHFGCLDAMFAALIAGTPPETDCTDNIKSMAMLFGALESSRSKQVVDLLNL